MGDLPDAVLRGGRGYARSISSRPLPRVLSCCLKAKLAFALSRTPSRPSPTPTGRVSVACRATLGADAGESSPPLPHPAPWLLEPYRFASHSLTKWSRLCLGGCVFAPPPPPPLSASCCSRAGGAVSLLLSLSLSFRPFFGGHHFNGKRCYGAPSAFSTHHGSYQSRRGQVLAHLFL